MARIFKGSTYQLQLLVSKCSVNPIENIKVSFFTTNPTIQVGVSEDITVAGNIATVRIPSNLFDSLDDGVLNYIVSGIVDGVAFITERQSNYYLKTDTQYIPQPSANIGQLHTEFIDYTGNGEAWWYASDYGLDGFNYVEINASAYGNGKYNQGYNDGKNASQNAVEFEYLEPNQVVDLVLNQGITGTFVIKGQITEVQKIDLKYGNSTYFLGDLKVFRGTGLNNSGIYEEDYFQVGDWVVIVGNVSNYNGTAQVDKGSTLVAKWREIPVIENKWGITGYFNNWGGTPDVYFEDPGFQLPFMDEWKDVRVVYGFETDGREIKIRYNNGWNHSYSAEIYNIPQIRPLIVSDMNMDLPANTYDVYLLGYNGEEKFEPQNILFVIAGTDINAFKLSDYLDIYNTYAPAQLVARNDYDGSEYSDTDDNMNIQVQFGNTITLRLNKSDGTIDERAIIYDGVTNSYIFN